MISHGRSGEDGVWAAARRAWGGALRPVAGELSGADLPAETRAFLREVGLPTATDVLPAFYHDRRLTERFVRGRSSFAPVADDTTVLYAVETATGHVYDLYPSWKQYGRFMNTDVARFVIFVGRYAAERAGLGDLLAPDSVPGPVFWSQVEKVREELAAWDPAAFADDTCWWWRRFEAAHGGEL